MILIKPPLHDQAAITQKKRIPVYILILVGIFLLAVLFYMFADVKPDAPATQPNTPVPATEALPIMLVRRLLQAVKAMKQWLPQMMR